MTKPPVTEAAWQAAIIELAQLFGWHIAAFRPAQTNKGWRTPVAADGQGWPDLTLVHPELGVIFAELKTDRGRLAPHQLEWRDRLTASGARWECWRPRDAPAVAAVLSAGRVTDWAMR